MPGFVSFRSGRAHIQVTYILSRPVEVGGTARRHYSPHVAANGRFARSSEAGKRTKLLSTWT